VNREEAVPPDEGYGPAVMAVDNLPCELPRESSETFSRVLKQYIPRITTADYQGLFEDCRLPPEIKKAVIVYQGRLTRDYQYLEKLL